MKLLSSLTRNVSLALSDCAQRHCTDAKQWYQEIMHEEPRMPTLGELTYTRLSV